MPTVAELRKQLDAYPDDAEVLTGPMTITVKNTLYFGDNQTITVEDEDGALWRGEDDPGEFYVLRFTTPRDLTDDELDKVFGAIAYSAKKNLRGERMGDPVKAGERTWECYYDITKSRSDDWLAHFDDFTGDAREFAWLGTPLRKDGTQLIEGVGPIGLDFQFS